MRSMLLVITSGGCCLLFAAGSITALVLITRARWRAAERRYRQ